MVKLGRTKHEDRSRAARYQAVARALLRTARDLETMGEPKYGNGLAIIAIHAAMATRDPGCEEPRLVQRQLLHAGGRTWHPPGSGAVRGLGGGAAGEPPSRITRRAPERFSQFLQEQFHPYVPASDRGISIRSNSSAGHHSAFRNFTNSSSVRFSSVVSLANDSDCAAKREACSRSAGSTSDTTPAISASLC